VLLIANLPERDELVIAVIKKIMPYGAFCILPEYNDLESFLHVSEVAPRWIKNIHEFISEGQRYVVKVHHVDPTKNQVDISIKRVNEEEKKHKLESIQNEKRGEKLLDISIKESGLKVDVAEIKKTLESEFGDVFSCFKEVSYTGEDVLSKVDLPAKLKAKIIEIAKKSIKRPLVTIDAIINFVSYGQNGLNDLKKAFTFKDEISIHYLGAPRYKVSITATDYKTAEKKLSAISDYIKAFAQKNDCDFSLIREKA
jgi:translation initiation factor 2 subunit 1